MTKSRLTAPEGARLIIDLPKRQQEIGKIKMGDRDKGNPKTAQGSGKTYYTPIKYDQFMIMSTEKDEKGFNKPDFPTLLALGAEPQQDRKGNWYTNPKLTEIDIMFPFNNVELILQTSYKYYAGGRVICWGNGLVANRQLSGGQIESKKCTCEFYEKNDCKINARLSCIIMENPLIGGVYVLRTTGRITTENLQTSVLGLTELTNSRLAGIPFKLILTMQKSEYEDKDGKMRPTVFPVATVVHNPKALLKQSQELYMPQIQERAVIEEKLLSEPLVVESNEEQGTFNEEFSPETLNEKQEDTSDEDGQGSII